MHTTSQPAFAAFGIALACCAWANEPALTVTTGGNTVSYAPAALLALPAAATLKIPEDVAYKRGMTFHAVPVAAVLAGVRPDDTIRFVARDGFVASLPAAALLAAGDGAVAYLAIESTDAPWPPLKAGDAATAGPFYVVWLRPERGAIVREQWPYQVVRIEAVAPLAKRYPMLAPAAALSARDPARHGFEVYVKNCSVCHTMNLGGDSTVGPDLNMPYNPTEYMRPDALRRLIRDPQSLRKWPDTRMPAFGAKVVSDRELTDLMAYLRHMADRRVAASAAK
jgi:mono/diheme cytochrome c family protein